MPIEDSAAAAVGDWSPAATARVIRGGLTDPDRGRLYVLDDGGVEAEVEYCVINVGDVIAYQFDAANDGGFVSDCTSTSTGGGVYVTGARAVLERVTIKDCNGAGGGGAAPWGLTIKVCTQCSFSS